MNESSYHLAGLDTSHVARPYNWTSSGYIANPHRGTPWYPTGLLRTSSLQLASFLNAFMQKGKLGNNRILDSSTVELMTTAHYPEVTFPSGLITMGLFIYQRYNGNRLAWGCNGNFSTGVDNSMWYCEAEKSGVIVLTNQFGAEGKVKILTALFDYAATIPTGLAESDEILLDGYTLWQNYPNPFNPSTSIEYALPKAGNVRLVIYDLLGRKVRTLVDNKQPAGHLQTTWDGTSEFGLPVVTGMYLCRIEAGQFVKITKLLLVK